MQHVWKAMQTTTLQGIPLCDVVGGGDPASVAASLLGAVDRSAPIKSGANILDLGCGCGRLALALAERGAVGSYVGIDIVPGLIEFAHQHITPLQPNFRFYTLDEDNQHYQRFMEARHDTVHSIADVVPAGSVDLCIATSLFTHLDFPAARNSLHGVAHALKPDGCLFMTCFIVDDVARSFIDNPNATSYFTFQHKSVHGALIEKLEDPTAALGMTYEQLTQALAQHDLSIRTVNFGGWSGAPNRPPFQDEVVAVRR